MKEEVEKCIFKVYSLAFVLFGEGGGGEGGGGGVASRETKSERWRETERGLGRSERSKYKTIKRSFCVCFFVFTLMCLFLIRMSWDDG